MDLCCTAGRARQLAGLTQHVPFVEASLRVPVLDGGVSPRRVGQTDRGQFQDGVNWRGSMPTRSRRMRIDADPFPENIVG